MEYPKRKNIRLSGYNYGQAGGYFLTICTAERRCILSHVRRRSKFVKADVELTPIGRIAETVLIEMAEKMGARVTCYVIMPNHIHLILCLPRDCAENTVGRYVGAVKSMTLHRWWKCCSQKGGARDSIWQRNYYDHVLRNENDRLEKMRYIQENPDAWAEDDLYVSI